MSWFKKSGIIAFLVLVGLLAVACQPGEQITLKGIWDKIIKVGTLEFLWGGVPNAGPDTVLVGFLRISIAILIFVLLFEASRFLPISRNARVAITLILAIISAIFLPGGILASIAGAYATLFGFILVGAPVVGGLFLVFLLPTDTGWGIALRTLLLVVLLFILMGVKNHALKIVPGVG